MSSQGTFVERLIDVTFTLADGSFNGTDKNTSKLSGLRVGAKIVKAGGNAMSTAIIRVFGMSLSMMNQLSTLGMRYNHVSRNSVTVEAGDAVKGMGIVFQGTITRAWADLNDAPEAYFHVEAHTGLLAAVLPTQPVSYPDGIDAATAMSSIASQLGYAFENNGVDVRLPATYLWGSPRSQIDQIARAARIHYIIDDGGNSGVALQKLVIWPWDGARGGQIPLISLETGMVGYPAFTAQGIEVQTLFNNNIGFGSKIEVKSSIPAASKQWIVGTLDHDLETKTFGGRWFSRIQAYDPGGLLPVTR